MPCGNSQSSRFSIIHSSRSSFATTAPLRDLLTEHLPSTILSVTLAFDTTCVPLPFGWIPNGKHLFAISSHKSGQVPCDSEEFTDLFIHVGFGILFDFEIQPCIDDGCLFPSSPVAFPHFIPTRPVMAESRTPNGFSPFISSLSHRMTRMS